jgi:hypothetical protein
MKQLAYLTEAANAKRFAFFAAVFVINLMATFMFGFVFLGGMYKTLLAFLPFAPSTLELISSVLGGLSAVLVCDIAYMAWNGIAMNSAQTVSQMTTARLMFVLSFLLSLAYTVITLGLLTFPHLLSLEQLFWMEAIGAISFTLILAGHISAAVFFISQDPNVKDQRLKTELFAKSQAERLSFQRRVATEALTLASAKVEDYVQGTAEQIGSIWTEDLMVEIKKVGGNRLASSSVAHQSLPTGEALIVDMPTNAHQSQIPAPSAQTASTNNRQPRTVVADEGDDWQTALGGDVPVMAMAFDSAPEAVVLTTAGDNAEGGDFFGHGR